MGRPSTSIKHFKKIFCIIAILFALIPTHRAAYAGMLDVDSAKEASIGEDTALEIIKYYGEVDDPGEIERIRRISESLVHASGRPDLPYHFHILNSDIINAMALPGGYVLVTRGLLDFVDDDDELASVLAHEIVHVSRKHGVTMYKQGMKTMFINFLLLVITQSPEAMMAHDMYSENKMTLFGRKAENEADKYAIDYMEGGGYNPDAFLTFLRRMDQYERKRPNLLEDYFETHAPTQERIRMVEDHFRELGLAVPRETLHGVRAKALAQESCETNPNGERKCYGLVVDGQHELIRFGDKGSFASAYERARAAALKLNELFGRGVGIYEVSIRTVSATKGIYVRNRYVASVLPGDVDGAADSESIDAVAEKWKIGIRMFLWDDFVKTQI